MPTLKEQISSSPVDHNLDNPFQSKKKDTSQTELLATISVCYFSLRAKLVPDHGVQFTLSWGNAAMKQLAQGGAIPGCSAKAIPYVSVFYPCM